MAPRSILPCQELPTPSLRSHRLPCRRPCTQPHQHQAPLPHFRGLNAQCTLVASKPTLGEYVYNTTRLNSDR